MNKTITAGQLREILDHKFVDDRDVAYEQLASALNAHFAEPTEIGIPCHPSCVVCQEDIASSREAHGYPMTPEDIFKTFGWTPSTETPDYWIDPVNGSVMRKINALEVIKNRRQPGRILGRHVICKILGELAQPPVTDARLREVAVEMMGAEISDYSTCAQDEEDIIQKAIAILRQLVEGKL